MLRSVLYLCFILHSMLKNRMEKIKKRRGHIRIVFSRFLDFAKYQRSQECQRKNLSFLRSPARRNPTILVQGHIKLCLIDIATCFSKIIAGQKKSVCALGGSLDLQCTIFLKIARYLGLFFLPESYYRLTTEADTGGVLYKKVFLKSLENSSENTCV